MPGTINFSSGAWGALTPQMRVCAGTMQNTYTDSVTDPTTSVSFIIASGAMHVDQIQGNRTLFFSTVDCQQVVQGQATVLIRFAPPQEAVSLRLNFDEHGQAPAMVSFFRQPNDANNPANLIRSQMLPWTSNAFQEVRHNDCCDPVGEILVRTDRPENNIDDVTWGPGGPRLRFLGRWLCLCQLWRPWRLVRLERITRPGP